MEDLEILHPLIQTAFVYLKHYVNPNAVSLMAWVPGYDLEIGNTTCKTNWSFQLQKKKSQNKSRKEAETKLGNYSQWQRILLILPSD